MAARGTQRRGFIRAFGLFWSADEVDWTPGAGNKGVYRILGRIGRNRPAVQVCDFRTQRGIYVLYDDYGPYYVGLARDQDIGNRLRTHTRDFHMGKWDRFSWFGSVVCCWDASMTGPASSVSYRHVCLPSPGGRLVTSKR